MKKKRQLFVAEIQDDLLCGKEIFRLYVEHNDAVTVGDAVKEYLEVNYNLKNVFIHTYTVNKENVDIIKRVATVICL